METGSRWYQDLVADHERVRVPLPPPDDTEAWDHLADAELTHDAPLALAEWQAIQLRNLVW